MPRSLAPTLSRRAFVAVMSLAFVAPAVASTPAWAADPDARTLGDLTVSGVWARASAGRAAAGAAFMTIANSGTADDRLIAAAADVSKVVELHTHIKDGEIMRMRQVEAIAVPGDETTVLQPGGLHVMFIGLHDPLREGQTFPLSLTFEQAGTLTVSVTVKGVGAMGSGMGMGMGHDQGHSQGKATAQ